MSMVKVMVSKDEMHSKKMDLSSGIVEKAYDLEQEIYRLDDSDEKVFMTGVIREIDDMARELKDIIYKEAVE
jgi:hypothetical protein